MRGRLPAWIFPSGGRITFHPRTVDVGMVQPHALDLDLEGTLRDLDDFEREWGQRVAEEADWLRTVGATVVLADVPPLAFAAAAETATAAFALANFSWDWIYQSYADDHPGFARHAGRAAACYREAELLFRLPFHGEMRAFRARRDVPLVVRKVSDSPAEARRRLGLPEDRPLVLLSFGGIGFREIALGALARQTGARFVTTDADQVSAEGVLSVERPGLDYSLLLRACDAVVTKPGYGITAATLVNGVRVLYTSRGRFPEYPILTEALEKLGTASFVAPDRLRRGDFAAELEAVLRRPVREAEIPHDGARVVCEALAGRLVG